MTFHGRLLRWFKGLLSISTGFFGKSNLRRTRRSMKPPGDPQATYDKIKDHIVAKQKYPRLKLTGVVSDSLILPSLWRAVFALVLLVAPVRGVAKSSEITIL